VSTSTPLAPCSLRPTAPSPPTARAAPKALLSKLHPEVLVLDAVRSGTYRCRLAADEPVEGKLETKGVVVLAPLVSVVDGLGAAVLAECEICGKAANMVVTWPAKVRPMEYGVTHRIAAELGVDPAKAAARVSDRSKLDALYNCDVRCHASDFVWLCS
jgi:hypothetical protein